MNFSIHQASHTGNRKYNQDRVAYAYSREALLLVLADGMGGHLHGELAAETAIDTFVESFGQAAQPRIGDPQQFIAGAMRHAHQRIMAFPHGGGTSLPGTTCVAALIQDGKMFWGHAGDSRLYLLRDGAVLAKTRDHSVVHQWLELGILSAEEARAHPQRNQITHCLGGVENGFYVEPGEPLELESGDVLLLGSDGLWGPFTDQELSAAMAGEPVAAVLDGLVELALARAAGRADNVTGVAMRWGDGEHAHDPVAAVSKILEIH